MIFVKLKLRYWHDYLERTCQAMVYVSMAFEIEKYFIFNYIGLNMKLNRNLRNKEAKIAVYIRVAWVRYYYDVVTWILMNNKPKLYTYYVSRLKIIRQTSFRLAPNTIFEKHSIWGNATPHDYYVYGQSQWR